MKKWLAVMMIVVTAAGSTGCARAAAEEAVKPRAVSVQTIQAEDQPNRITYVGTVGAKELVRYSFKTPGRISTIHVAEGDSVTPGMLLASLDPKELQFQADVAMAGLRTAEAAARKAEEACRYDEAYLEKMAGLLEAQSISQDQYEQLKVKATASKESLAQALAQVEALRADEAYKGFLLENTQLRADRQGVVAQVLNESAEQVAAYYPVIVVRSAEQVVNVGIPQRDVESVEIGAAVQVEFDGVSYEGVLTGVDQVPDTATRTYKGEITLTEGQLPLGAIVRVHLVTGSEAGIWIPVGATLSEGESYVFVVESERVYRKVIEVTDIRDNRLQVSGLEAGQQVVVEGMKNLSDGMMVQVTETR